MSTKAAKRRAKKPSKRTPGSGARATRRTGRVDSRKSNPKAGSRTGQVSARRKKPTARSAPKRPKATPLLIRTSERSTFKRCRWAWERGYVDRLKPIDERPALRFGTLIHAALEARYPKGKKRGPKPAGTFVKLYDKQTQEAIDTWGFRVDEKWENARDVGVDMMEMFVETYGRDEDWEVIASEMTFKVPVYTPPAPGGGYLWVNPATGEATTITKKRVLFYYVGTMDGVWRNRMDGGVRVVDWKTTRNDPEKESLGKSVLDEQGTAYWTWGVDFLIAKKLLKPRDQEALDGMLYTFLRKARRDTRPQNAQGQYLNQPKKDGTQEISKTQPPLYFYRDIVYRSESDREKARERAIQEVTEMIQGRLGLLPLYKTPNTGPMGHCGWCQFRDICELHESGADWEGLRDGTMTVWDPYDAHEIEQEGKQ